MSHEEIVRKLLSGRTVTGFLKSSESNTVEFKESFNKHSTAKYAKKYKWKLLVAFAIFIVAIPFVINILFKITLPWSIFAAEWEAGDALTFYGAMLASATTIIGVYISIEYAQRNYRIDEANRVKPYFALTHYRSRSKLNLLGGSDVSQADENVDEQNQDVYEEYKLEKVYIVIGKAGIEFKDKLSAAQQQCLKSGGFEWCSYNGRGYSLRSHPLVSDLFEVENVGNGAAINTMIVFYRKDEKQNPANLYTIKQGGSFHFHIFCENTDIVNGSDYVIELQYWDIIGNNYSQEYPITFGEDPESKYFCTTVDMSGKQKLRI